MKNARKMIFRIAITLVAVLPGMGGIDCLPTLT